MNARVLLVQTTVSTPDEAGHLADTLIARRLAACVQMAAIKSTYRWEGELETAGEIRLDIKTSPARKEALLSALHELHPYDEPEILIIPVSEASEGYAKWVAEETSI